MKLKKGERFEDVDLIFCQDNGRLIKNVDAIRMIMGKALEDAGCPWIPFHDHRHRYASLLIDQRASPNYIQTRFGHFSIQVTFDTYGHLMPEPKQEIVQRLDEQVFGAD